MLSNKIRPAYEFGPFRLVPTERLLQRDGRPVPLTPKAFETLVALVEHRGHLVGKDELLSLVWAEDFVEEGNLARCVHTLRKALGEGHGEHQYIETVPKSGYRFVAEVREARGAVGTLGAPQDNGSKDLAGEASGVAGLWAEPTVSRPEDGARVRVPAPPRTAPRRRPGPTTVFISLSALVLMTAAVAYFYFTRGRQAVTDKSPIDSIAVLPFVNTSGDPEAEYLSDGISDSTINSLSQLPSLKRVISLTSAQRYKGKQTDPQTVGRDLNVRAVLIGRLTQRGDDLSISAELVDVTDNKQLWHRQYDLKLADALKLRGVIAQEISNGLRLKLTSREKQQLAKSSTTNPEAYQLYLLGRFYQHNREHPKARDYLEQAIKKDPNYAPAYAQLAFTYSTAAYSDDWSTRSEALKRQKWAAQRALELDDTLGDAHAALALTIYDWSVRPREFQRALELDPNSADIHGFYARVLWGHRRIDEAILHMKRAVELDPLSHTSQADLGKMLYSAGQRDQAMEQYRKALDLNPNYGNVHKHLANYYLTEGKYEEAIAAAEKMNANVPDKLNGKAFLGYTYAVTGKKAEAVKILHALQEEAKQRHVSSEKFALIYTGLGDKNRAFELLQKQVDEYKMLPIFINVQPEWASLRTDPRFDALLQQSEWHRE